MKHNNTHPKSSTEQTSKKATESEQKVDGRTETKSEPLVENKAAESEKSDNDPAVEAEQTKSGPSLVEVTRSAANSAGTPAMDELAAKDGIIVTASGDTKQVASDIEGSTLGQLRVRHDYNPTNHGLIHEIKKAGALLIDLINVAKTGNDAGQITKDAAISSVDDAVDRAVKLIEQNP